MNLNIFMEHGISGVMRTAARFYLNSIKGRLFLSRILLEIHKSAKMREAHEQAGTHIPPLLIASIASECNLNCGGCYARASDMCGDSEAADDLSALEWNNIFSEAAALGISFILLAGGEPLTRPDVIKTAADFPGVIFPIFTNGTMLDRDYTDLFDRCRNLIPVISIEGGAGDTDCRRGGNVYSQTESAMERLTEKNILFGISITATHENVRLITSDTFIAGQRAKGCGLVFFVEYVPVAGDTEHLVLSDQDICVLEEKAAMLNRQFNDMIIISFPGDEKAMGGCLASGRGFFHINSRGGAEPCPFSPFSKHNLKSCSILNALRSEFFYKLREIAASGRPRHGGCTLFDRKDEVQSLLKLMPAQDPAR